MVRVTLDFEDAETAASFLRKRTKVASDTVEPTWTNSRGETFRLRDMPTPYLRNLTKFAWRMVADCAYAPSKGPGSGLIAAIRRELERRTD